jgi:signal transduction histidine kinase
MTGRLAALLRCAVLAGLVVAGFVYAILLVGAAAVVIPYPLVLAGQFRLTALGRRLARDWCGADVPDARHAPPPAPHRREDGWYVHDRTLFRRPLVPAFLVKIEHYGKDQAAALELRWLMLTPFMGGIAVLLPPAAVTAAVLVLARSPWSRAWSVPAALAAAAAGVVLAPAALRAYGWWTQAQLRGGNPSWWRRSSATRWVARTTRTALHGGGLGGISLAAFAGQLLNLLALAVAWRSLLPYVAPLTRPLVDLYRRHACRWLGTDLPAPYRPYPPSPAPGEDGAYRFGRNLSTDLGQAVRAQRPGWVLRDPATWRDLLWSWGALLLAPLSWVPLVLLGTGFFGPFWQALWWPLWGVPYGLSTGNWVSPFYLWSSVKQGVQALVPVPAWFPDWASVPGGLLVALIGLGLAVPLIRLRQWWDRLLLRPTASTALAARVAHLTTTRADAVDAQAAELRRIERDLHDGAQARLVAVGLGLATVARLMDTDPQRARRILAQAQDTSAAALTELRGLVRGIHPPVLAERGLGDAVRAVALDTPLPVAVDADLPGRLEPPVESAAYFAVCEALANAARVAAHVSITLAHRDGTLRMVVTDDGPGGADPALGTGLRGIERRLGTFDGTMTLDSPSGGPTVVTMEIPCA